MNLFKRLYRKLRMQRRTERRVILSGTVPATNINYTGHISEISEVQLQIISDVKQMLTSGRMTRVFKAAVVAE